MASRPDGRCPTPDYLERQVRDLTLGLSLLFAVACSGPKRDGDVEDSIGTDDSVAGGDADSGTEDRSVTGVITPCYDSETGFHYADSYLVHVGTGGATLTGDTIDEQSTFDMALHETNEDRALGDDEVPCSYPPVQYACPQAELIGPADYEVVVYAKRSNMADPETCGYLLTLVGDASFTGAGRLNDDLF